MSNYFKSTKLGGDAPENEYMVDGGDALANEGYVVAFEHVPSGKIVFFKAFINSLNETYSCDWNTESVYGRTDPIQIFKQTTRNITLSLMVPASSISEGYQNLARVEELATYLYPSYENVNNALTIAQSPLIRLSVMNLIKNHNSKKTTFQSLKSGTQQSIGTGDGLLGVIRNLTVNHNIESLENGSFMLPGGKILPKAIEITLDFTAIHEKTLGWQGENFSSDAALYGTEYPIAGSGGGSADLGNANENQAANVNPLGGNSTEQVEQDAVADASNLITQGAYDQAAGIAGLQGEYVNEDGDTFAEMLDEAILDSMDT